MSSRFFQNNLTLKIISVIIAIILWLYAVSELNPEVTKNISDIPVTVMNEDALNGLQLTLAEKPADSITIRIRGLVNDIRKVNTANLKAVLDLKTVDWTGTRQVELNIEGLLPREVKLDKIPEISLTVDKVISKTVPVTVDRTGSGAKGYFVHPESVEPQTIGIYGAQSLVDSIVKGIVQVNLNNDESTIEKHPSQWLWMHHLWK
jgi:YbbR domain-containing protein